MSQKICIVEYSYYTSPTIVLYDAFGQKLGESEISVELYNQLDK